MMDFLVTIGPLGTFMPTLSNDYYYDSTSMSQSPLLLVGVEHGYTTTPVSSYVSFEPEQMGTKNEFSNSSTNTSSSPTLPIDMQFNEGHRLAIIVYSLLMIISAVGNISVFSAIVKLRIKGRLSRINLFLLHLTVADLLVTFLMMPLEIAWNATVSWRAGDVMCRLMLFFRTFGLYLSGFILVCISMDRYFAVLKPLAIPEANSRGKIMLTFSWFASVICSLPQSFIFHVETHPHFKWYNQCITYNSFPTENYELAYNLFNFSFMYGYPLTMIIFCYTRILYEIYRINALKKNEEELRRSSMGALGRAKIRTLKMTVLIVGTFFCCWTPYYVMSLWYWFDKETAKEVDQRIQKGLFLFACTNSCVNPLIYGLFHFRPRKKSNTGRSPPVNGYRPTVPSQNYKMRVRWKPNDCCLMGCRSSNSGSTPVISTTRGRENHIHIRPTQQLWAENTTPRHPCHSATSEQPTRRDFTIANGHSHVAVNGILNRYVQQHHQNEHHQRRSNVEMSELNRNNPRADSHTTVKRHFIDDKNSKRSCLSSIL